MNEVSMLAYLNCSLKANGFIYDWDVIIDRSRDVANSDVQLSSSDLIVQLQHITHALCRSKEEAGMSKLKKLEGDWNVTVSADHIELVEAVLNKRVDDLIFVESTSRCAKMWATTMVNRLDLTRLKLHEFFEDNTLPSVLSTVDIFGLSNSAGD